ncbi:sigma-70 family RNA polymerase sigma factor [Egicoccus halophilus]|uniref:DNA-directed RNA polymerase sigma-70 factor n=1 Tax=Egicoccus halophilus TaxID=1670830 RepID=A0A8J3EUX8_9ACTN|nr:sigma-70 family RNA polymerase sigma factor [Egicoccus halophilus]GGI08568.1 DNA-directed RNA polymerase sigma-70 factor [Egicoccus halophilus]
MSTLTVLPEDAVAAFEPFRRELTGYCYRMLGSGADADDAVQETLVRAWRAYDRFEGRASVRTWLYRIATNVCLDQVRGRKRRARPMDLGPSTTVAAAELIERDAATWVEPVPDGAVLPTAGDPAELAVARETVRLAFVAALQHLPPRQRAVLLLREVLQWHADEVAQLLDTTVASVNSALQRARATLANRTPAETDPLRPDDPAQRELLARYVDAFERYDMDALAALLREDAIQNMPPYDLWLQGRDQLVAWMVSPGPDECRGSRLLAVEANGMPAFAQYRPDPGGGHRAWALQVLEIVDGRILAFNSFLDVERLFPRFGLPLLRNFGAVHRGL